MPQHEATPTDDDWLSTEEAMAYLGVRARLTLYRYRRDRGLPSYKVGNIVRFRRSDLDAWLQAHRETTGTMGGHDE